MEVQFAANKTAGTFSAKWFNWPDDMLGSYLEMASVVKSKGPHLEGIRRLLCEYVCVCEDGLMEYI